MSTILGMHAVSMLSCQAHRSEAACCSWTGQANQSVKSAPPAPKSIFACSLISEMAAAGPEAELGDLIPKKNGMSVIWEYFGFEATDVHQKQVLCKTCRAKVATSSGNTTNLYRHLKNHHGNLHDECMMKKSGEKSSLVTQAHSSKQTTIRASFASVIPYDKSSRRHREITTAITHYIGKDMVSVNMVPKDRFENLLHTLDRRYVISSRTYFNQVAIPQLCAECKEKVVTELKNVEYYATTTDMWSSRTTEPYLSLTVHFVNDNFELKSRCRQTAYFPTDHTGENIALGLRECLSSWGLNEEEQMCITTDNAANVIKAVELNQWTRLKCFGHRLHLAIGKCKSVCLCECLFVKLFIHTDLI